MDGAFEIPEGFFLKSKQREIGEADADAVRLFCNLLKGSRKTERVRVAFLFDLTAASGSAPCPAAANRFLQTVFSLSDRRYL